MAVVLPRSSTAGYGISHPAGGNWNAASVAVQAGGCTAAPVLSFITRRRATAATAFVPPKLTQPCMAIPGTMSAPKHTMGDPTPGQGSPHMKGPGSR